jgi:uncharacterized protein (TIGR03083 family)
MTEASLVIAALRSAHDDLAVRNADFDADDLARISGSREWTVAQVLSHLGSGSVITLATLEHTAGNGTEPVPDFNRQVWARWDAMAPDEQASEFVTADAALVEWFESVPDHDADSLRISLPWLPVPLTLAQMARMRLNEVALHSWDVRVAFDGDAVVAPDATRALLHGEPSLIGRIGRTDVLDGAEVVVDVTTTDPHSTFALVLGEKVEVDHEREPSSENSLALPAESWLRLVAGRLAPEDRPSGVVSAGPIDLDVLRKVFPGY